MEFKYKKSCLIEEKDILKSGESVLAYLRHLNTVAQINTYDFPESSINLPFDTDLIQDVLKLKKEKIKKGLKYVIVIGVGGSNLGARAIYDATYGYFDSLEPDRYPKMIFADTNDPEFLSKLEKFLESKVKKPEEIIVNAISKSGETIETVVNLEFIMKILEKRFNNARERLVITTDHQSRLWNITEKENISLLQVPEKVGGRYSVFSGVGLFPLISVGIDIEKLLEGAKEMRAECISENILGNPAALSAIILFTNFKKNNVINDNFFFHPELESVGKWYRQLMAESIGKEKDMNGEKINAGITPTVSIGSTDLHSVAQLYLGGPRNRFTTFLWSKNDKGILKVPQQQMFDNLVKGTKNKPIVNIMEAIYQGVKITYTKKKLPFAEVILPEISLYYLGQFLQFKMIEIMILGNLLNVNTFNQPNVEDYKKEIRRLLGT